MKARLTSLRDSGRRLVRRLLRAANRRQYSFARLGHGGFLGDLTARLQGSNRELEQQFGALSEIFMPLHTRMNALQTQCDELVALASGKRNGMTLFQEAVQLLHEPILYVDFCISQHARLLELFVNTERRLQSMLSFQRRMEPLLAPLTYIEVLIKIESASLDAEQRDTFLTVVNEIERLHNLVSDTFGQNTELLARTLQTLTRVRAKLETDFERHSAHTAERRKQIEHAISSLDEQLSSDGSREVRIQTFSRELSQAVSHIVTGIQTQDIVSQKVGHVADAVGELHADRTGAGHILELQAAQLDGISGHIREGATTISGGIAEIGRLAVEIDRNALSMDEFTQMTASADGMVQQLLDAFAGVRDIIDSTLGLAREAHEATQPARHIATSLSTTLGELSTNMRLIALNAQVRSVQITQGTGLEILAARTAAISSEISEVSELVTRDLEQLRVETEEMIRLLEEFETRGRAQLPVLDSQKLGCEQRLHELRDTALSVLATIGDSAREIQGCTAQAAAPLEGIGAIATRFHETRGLIESHLTAGGHHPDDEACDRTQERLERHAGRYTMHSERIVHQRRASAGDDAPAATPAEPIAAVEFFEDAPAAATPAATNHPARSALPAATPASAPAPAADLGANVDLF